MVIASTHLGFSSIKSGDLSILKKNYYPNVYVSIIKSKILTL